MFHPLRIIRGPAAPEGAGAASGSPYGGSLPAATTLFIETTSECNLRCRHCHMWLTREPPASLSTAEKVDLLTQFAAWAPRSNVVLTGGETMLKREEFFALGGACRRLGLKASANTNGTLLDEPTLERLLHEGPRCLIFSLDSHRADVHDWVRGVPGTFDRAVGAVRALLGRRKRGDVMLLTNTVLFDRNVPEVDRYVAFARSLGVDGMTFQVLARTFCLRTGRDGFFDEHFPRDPGAFDRAADTLIALRRLGLPIGTTENDLRWMKLYVRNPDFIGEPVCGSAERNLMVDQHGEVQLCFSMRDVLGGRSLGNVRSQSLESMWGSALAGEARAVMGGCRRNCGMLNCHRRQVAT